MAKRKKKSSIIRSIKKLSKGGKKSGKMARMQSLFTVGGSSQGNKRKVRYY